MKRSRFTEDQVIGILKEHEAGVSVADLCRKHGVSDATVCKWKAKYGGMDVSEAKRLKGLEDENARLKRSRTDALLCNTGGPEAGIFRLFPCAVQPFAPAVANVRNPPTVAIASRLAGIKTSGKFWPGSGLMLQLLELECSSAEDPCH